MGLDSGTAVAKIGPMRRGRPLLIALLVAFLLVGGGTVWWLAVSPPEDDAAPSASHQTPPAPPARKHARATATSPAPETLPAAPQETTNADGDWASDLKLLLAGDKSRTAKAVIASAGKGRPPGDGLHEILLRGTTDRAKAASPAERLSAQAMIDWAIENALRPYRQDRARFAPLYRSVRFGSGDLGAPGGSPVREWQFDDAARRIDRVRRQLQTWCYDALAIRAAASFRSDATWWAWYAKLCRSKQWDVPPEAGSVASRTTPPAAIFTTFVRPHLPELTGYAAMGLGIVFLDLGELDAAAECLARTRQELATAGRADLTASYEPKLDALDVEIAAFRELRGLTALKLPASATDFDDVARWFANRRLTDVAHAIGTDGDVEIGPWDDAMTASFLAGGLSWAPEQWMAARARAAAAVDATKDGVRGVVVRSPTWEIFTDVSADFGAQASLVLEAGFAQAQDGLGVVAANDARIGARIYRNRAAYQAITHDGSRGEWIPNLNSLLTFLDDPLHDDFEQFYWPVLIHEATHAAIRWSVGDAPAWMHEGLACYVQRWNPSRSMAVNVTTTRDFVRRARTLAAARDAGRMPKLDDLLGLRTDWVADEFGPITLTRYAAAESLFVYLADSDEHWTIVGAMLVACRNGGDPASLISEKQRAEIAKGWAMLVDFECGQVPERR